MALDFSSTKFYHPINSMVYKGLRTDLEKQSRENLKAIDENLKPLELDEKVKNAQSGMINIYFRDPITQNITNSALSTESIEKLKNTFGSADFYQRKDGSYILNGDVEKFVSSWYGDIAYQRGYLAADANHDGYLNKNELDETRSGFTSHGYFRLYKNKIIESNLSYVESYVKLNGIATAPDGMPENFKKAQKTLYNEGKFAAPTLALELDKTIKNDKDSDGLILYKEILNEKEMEQQSMDLANYVILDYTFDPTEGALTLLDLLLRDEDALKIFGKLADNNFDTKSLSKEELETLKKNFKEFFNENGDFDKEKFQKYYEDLKEQFVDKSLDFLGLSKQDYQDGTLNLDLNQLNSVIKDIVNTFKEANTTPSNYGGLRLDLSL
ncbi:hypothetical protein [Campylobacter aviculae]|uniref:EF-hand domain-containing protein n=1 Tax=Campylobacter aviculae TaxID=2510190 RepID=A0A4U7BQ80_9BACT|nr:hypothetical protein [Campylobacter aviculae]TKX32485.1 hypothetical protein CQA76_04000 [Campylobacter aviculae]